MAQLTGLLGVALFLGLGVLLSTSRRAINLRIVLGGLALQLALAFLCLRFPPFVRAFDLFAAAVTKVISFADQGTEFIFGENLPNATGPWGFVFAVKVLPVIIFFASLMGVLYHLGIMQRIVASVAWVLRRTLGVTGAEALSAAANIFVGQTEAPLCVKPYIAAMTRSQIMAIMTGGFATIAGSVMAAYIGLLGGDDDAARIVFAKHLMTASVMSAPAGLVMAKLMLPETGAPREETLRSLLAEPRATRNVLDAAAAGATDGLRLAMNVAAMLVAFVALLAMINWPLAALSEWKPIAEWRAPRDVPVLTLQVLFGYLLTPVAWCMGVAPADCRAFASLLGTQVIATEFVAYVDLSEAVANGTLSPRTCKIATYALCGFANLPSIAIQIGGLSAISPERRGDFAAIGLRAMVAGALACWMTGAISGVFIAP
jgi:CNT family concentrative nucleoside transporter